jgi:Ca2+-binding RTX toxin-like protein
MHQRILPRLVTASAVAVVLSTGTAAAATAATNDYHPTAESRDFATSAGGWTAATTHTSQLCVDGVTCPTVTNSFVATGGAGGDGDGFLRTATSATVAGVLDTTTATWTSPAFTYHGAGGQTPDSVSFTLDRRVDAASLLSLLSNARYRVHLDDLDNPAGSLTLVDQPITNQLTWASVAAVDVPPAGLTIGDHYQFRIVTELENGAAVVPGGTFDYDNVLLRATLADPVPHDSDGDGVADSADNCPSVQNTGQADADHDGIGDACDTTPGGPDTDGDGVPNATDNCVNTPNPGQADTDGDGIGDACEGTGDGPDHDSDGITDPVDNCVNTANPGQADTDKDGVGDACDPTPNGQHGPNGPTTGTCQGVAAQVQVGQNTGDTLRGTQATDVLKGQRGNDRLVGRGGDDCLKGGEGKDTLRGQAGRDVLSGNAGRDVLTGATGADRLRGQRGNDTMKGGRDDDKVNGGLGQDRLAGGAGNDVLLGGNQADRLAGGKGKDTLSGGRGDDRLLAADGMADVVRCGGGMDKVVADALDKVATSCEVIVIKP